MRPRPSPSRTPVLTAMICAAAVTAQFVAGKATRDALYLANLDVTSLPMMIVATSIFSIAMVAVASKLLGAVSPATFVPLAFLVSSGLLLLVEWALCHACSARRRSRRLPADLRHRSAARLGLLAHRHRAFRSRAPRRRRFGQIAGAGTFGGLLGGLFAERVARHLRRRRPCFRSLAVMNLLCAWQIRQPGAGTADVARAIRRQRARLRSAADSVGPSRASRGALPAQPRRARRCSARSARRSSTTSSRSQAVATFGRGDALLRFFAMYYAAISLITFVVQTSGSRIALEKLGLAVTTGTPSLALLLTGIASLAAPGLQSTMVARGGEVDFPRLALPRGVRALLYADRGRGEARRQVDHRRWHGPPRRCTGRRRHSTADRRPAGRSNSRRPSSLARSCFRCSPWWSRAASIADTCTRWSAAC